MTDFFGSEITRKIWSSLDNIILIYLGSAADFPLCKDNHWLFYTNKLPSNPQKRFIDTFVYNQKLFFTPKKELPGLLKKIRGIHTNLEKDRSPGPQTRISNQGFLEVLFMLTDYALRGWEYLNQRKLSETDKNLYIKDINCIAKYMGIEGFPENYAEFTVIRKISMDKDLAQNPYTDKLYQAYLNDLGKLRYWILLSFQREFIPEEISKKLKLKRNILFYILYKVYPKIQNELLFKIILKFLLKPETEKALYKLKQN